MPTGFRLAAARFAADAGEVMMTPFTGPLAFTTEGAVPSPVETAPSQTTIGDIVFEIDGRGKDTRQLAQDIVREPKTLAVMKFGDTSKWGQL